MAESGLTLPVKTTIHTRNDVAGFQEACEVIQANLKEIGIDVEIVGTIGSVDQQADSDETQKTPMGIVTFSMDFPDGQAFLNLLLDPGKPEFGGSYAAVQRQVVHPELRSRCRLVGRRSFEGLPRSRREGHEGGRSVGTAARPRSLRFRLVARHRVHVQPGNGQRELQHRGGDRLS